MLSQSEQIHIFVTDRVDTFVAECTSILKYNNDLGNELVSRYDSYNAYGAFFKLFIPLTKRIQLYQSSFIFQGETNPSDQNNFCFLD